MRTTHRSALLVFVLLSGMLACAVPGLPQTDSGALGTSLAVTLNAIIEATQNALPVTSSPTIQPSPTLNGTISPGPATKTPTETATVLLIHTPTPFFPQISVSVPTNCRVGPGNQYERVGALLVGETVQVYARDPTGDFWYIQNPDSSNEYCWVWGKYATVTGLTYILPVYTPPPTPTATATPLPSFDASFSGLVICTGWWPEIRLKNTGLLTFRSVGISLKDTNTSTSVYSSSDGFNDNPDCTTSTSRKTLLAGKSVTVSAPGFVYDPTGHKLRATITLCSDTGQSGTCVTDTITFTP
jgi:hypothetical protein